MRKTIVWPMFFISVNGFSSKHCNIIAFYKNIDQMTKSIRSLPSEVPVGIEFSSKFKCCRKLNYHFKVL